MGTSAPTLRLGVVVGAVLLLAAMPVVADPPVHLTYDDFYYQGPFYGPAGPVVCDGEPIMERSVYHVRQTLYLENGVLTRIKGHWKGESVLTNPATGKEARGTWGWTAIDVNPPSDDWKYVGNPIKAIIPGVGIIMQDAGLQIYDHGTSSYIKIVGTYQWNLNDFEEFCAAMR
jgi:hypothetical protein